MKCTYFCGENQQLEKLLWISKVEKMKQYVLLVGMVFGMISHSLGQEIEPINFDQLSEYMAAREGSDSIYVYNFWATWCKPCVAELPYFEQLPSRICFSKSTCGLCQS